MRHYSDYNNKDEYWHFGVDEEQGLLDFLLANAKETLMEFYEKGGVI